MDKHLLAENPMRPQEGGIAVIRTVKPVSIFEVHNGHLNLKGTHKHYRHNEEEYTFEVKLMFFEGVLSREELPADTDFKYMDDAWHWFRAYMEWEDEQVDELE